MHNESVKATRRPNAVLKVCSFIGFGGFAKVNQAPRPLPLTIRSSGPLAMLSLHIYGAHAAFFLLIEFSQSVTASMDQRF